MRDFCVCAGSRNSPLLAVLGDLTHVIPSGARDPGVSGGATRLTAAQVPRSARDDVSVYSFVDERSAAFFALGRAKRDGVRVAVVTTSGTAVAELLPAAVEAFYASTPLVFVTADRPERYRGTGAPQCIDQTGIFGLYADTSLAAWTRTRALHLNIEFDEPLIDE